MYLPSTWPLDGFTEQELVYNELEVTEGIQWNAHRPLKRPFGLGHFVAGQLKLVSIGLSSGDTGIDPNFEVVAEIHHFFNAYFLLLVWQTPG